METALCRRCCLRYTTHRRLYAQNDPVSVSFLSTRDLSLRRFAASSAVTKRRENEPPETAVRRVKGTPPEKPDPGDCCGSGCVRCVWDVYREELDSYNDLVKEFDSQDEPDEKRIERD